MILTGALLPPLEVWPRPALRSLCRYLCQHGQHGHTSFRSPRATLLNNGRVL